MASGITQHRMVRILEADPSLAAPLTDEDLARARRIAVAHVTEVAPGTHRPAELGYGEGLLGLLVLDGLLVRHVGVAQRRCGELVGPGAVLRPWDDFGGNAPLPLEIEWRVIQGTRLAMLDQRFVATIAHWPALIETFVARVTERAHTLAFNVAVHCLQHIDVRLLVLFWHLADRFGKMTPTGIWVPLPLSHADLGELVGAARPSVSLALKQLADAGEVWRNEDGRTWMMKPEPPSELRDMRAGYGSTAA